MSRPAPETYQSVNSLPTKQVVDELALEREPRTPRGYYKCIGIACTSSNALHLMPRGGFYCFSCGQSWSNVDAAVEVWGVSPAEACARLAERFGIPLIEASQPTRAQQAATPRLSVRPPPDDGLAGLRAEGLVPCLASSVFTTVASELLPLTDAGAEYLRTRALDPDHARQYGFRSIDGPEDWQRLAGALSESFLLEELAASGFASVTGDRLAVLFPWRGRMPALVIPYRHGAEVTGLRFRSLGANVEKRFRYMSLVRQRTSRPFNSDVLRDSAGAELQVCEGELDALTLIQRGYSALALGGASPAAQVVETVARGVRNVKQVVIWQDRDAAGVEVTKRLCDEMQRLYGLQWRRAHVAVRRPTRAKDINEIFATGGAI